jgi:hypothetical protein
MLNEVKHLDFVGRAWVPKRGESRLGYPSPLARTSCEDARPTKSESFASLGMTRIYQYRFEA